VTGGLRPFRGVAVQGLRPACLDARVHVLRAAVCSFLLALPAAAPSDDPKAPRTAPVDLTPEERAWLVSHGPIRLITEPAYPPVEWFDESGRYSGMVAEYFELLEARLGTRIEVLRAPSWEEAMRRARAHEVDGLTAAEPTPERSFAFDWTPPLLRIPSVVIARANADGDFTLEGLKGKVVAVSSGNALHEFLRSAHPGVHVEPQPDDLSALLAVSFGRADAALVNLAVATYLIEQHGINNLRLAASTGRSNVLAMATGKHQPLLASILAKGLASVTPPEREAIQGHWLRMQPGGHLVSWRTAAAWGAGALGFLLVIALLAVAWNRELRRQVDRATVDVQRELAERRRAEEAERRRAAELQAVLDAVPAAVFITRDRHSRRMETNRFGSELLGVSPGSNISKSAPAGEAPANFRAMKDGAEIPPERLPVQLAASRGEEVRDYQFDVVSEDGTVTHLLGNATPFRDEAGQPAGAVAAFSDVTWMKRAEVQRQQSEERFRALIENAVDMIVLLDGVGRIRFASPNLAEHLGRPVEVVKRRALFAFAHPDDRPRLEQAFATLCTTPGATARFEGRISHRDGTWRLVEGEARNLLENPAVRGVVLNARDVTEQRRTEELFQHAQKLESVGRLAGGVAHDFNNLLTVILSGAHEIGQCLQSRSPVDPEIVDDIRVAGERARGLTSQLLSFARKQVIAPVPLDINDVVGRSEGALRRMLGEDVELEVVLQPGLWTTLCDPGQIEQVVLNLAVNARDAMPGGGKLTIETRNVEVGSGATSGDAEEQPGHWVRLLVHDSGPGIPPHVKAHLFEPFFTTKARGKGTGLGLATVHGIVHQAGGHLHVQSEPGRGTTFEICFPRKDGTAPTTVARHESTPVGGSETVLVVEDDPAVRALTVRTLRMKGYQVQVAASGQEIRELGDDQVVRLHLLVTDVIMPGLNGREVADELRRRRPGLPVLYISGYSANAFADGSSLDPRSSFLAKPFTAPTLLRRVREILDQA
jgi:PAS domain S-box-containing protein